MDENKFLTDIQDYINKRINFDIQKKDLINCNNCFSCDDQYKFEKEIVQKIKSKDFQNTTEQGNLLEDLVKSLFKRITLISSLSVTNKDTALGQIDINLIPIDETIYEIWGMIGDFPSCLIGECKNYNKSSVGRPEIEKMCWRTGKGQALSFFIAPSYTKEAIEEISYFNLSKESILKKSQGVYLVPLTLKMLEIIVDNNLNFCYFIRWAIQSSKKMAIANYL
ncbi:hypothetical protein IQ215_01275 [Cyanobacterium stanieri LEGE 03274]|uniref:Restriction endonuclease type IV Mrr domain-containing protein n=1 Tax=Cyanobacterium stanieri LEGE 03274 TaxID=1828756 RepID=A0ABR9V2J6_9CHRO|nr:hypothetical protein [Cyanobacterium stanieri]MBE9221316.1 hypothetical protein [Cyanobacterium stanieri LEGE 03274]